MKKYLKHKKLFVYGIATLCTFYIQMMEALAQPAPPPPPTGSGGSVGVPIDQYTILLIIVSVAYTIYQRYRLNYKKS